MKPIRELIPWFVEEQASCRKHGSGHVPPALRNVFDGAEEDEDKAAYLSTLITILQNYDALERTGTAGDITLSVLKDLADFLAAEKDKHNENAYKYAVIRDKFDIASKECDARTFYQDAEIYVLRLYYIAKG